MSGFKNRTRPGGRRRWKDTENVTEDSPTKSSDYATKISVKTSRHSLTQGSSDLCELYVSGPCYCSRLHHQKRSPYVWQYQIKPDVWSLLSTVQMELLEQAFCNNEERTVVEIKRFGDVKETTVTFDEILDPPSRSSVNKFSFQRLSTRSYAEAGSDPIVLYTQWVWYWKDNNDKWSSFVPPELQLTLETKYLAGQNTYFYTIADQEYRLDFTSLVQVNRKYLTRRPVQRRPMFVYLDDARSRQQTCSSLLMSPAAVTPTDVPSNWAPLDRYQDSEKVELDASSDEFTTVMSSIYKTLSAERCQVQRLYRLQNALLWHNFLSMRKTLQMSHSTESIDQRQLFHGTDTLDVVNNICINNFDFRVSGKNATVYGKGAYFARDAKYSHNYTKGRNKYMFLARVLVGKYTLGDSSYTRPPPRKGHVLYDSCVNDINNPSIFIIFERNQCYPEYLVEYRDGSVDESVSVNRRNGPQGAAGTSVTSASKHSSPLQPVPAATSPTKTPSVKSTGNSSLNQNQTIPATSTSVMGALKHSSPVQPVPAAPSQTTAPSMKSTGNSSLNLNQTLPATNTSVTGALKHSFPVQPVSAAPSTAKTPSVKSTGNSSFLMQNQTIPATPATIPATNTVSASSSSSNQRQVNPGQSNTSVSPIHTPPRKRSSVGNGAVLGLGSRGRGQGIDDQHTGNASLNQNQTMPATSTSVTGAFKHSSPVQSVPAAPSPTKTPSVKSTGNSSITTTVSASFSSSNQRQVNPWQSNTSPPSVHTPPSNRRSSVGHGAVLGLGTRGPGQGCGDRWSMVDDLSEAEKTIRTGHSSATCSNSSDDMYDNSSYSDKTLSNHRPVHGQSALSQKTSTAEGSGLKSQHHHRDKSSDYTLPTFTLRQSVLSQKTSPSAGLSTSNNHNEMDASRACSQSDQSQIYYKVSCTRTTAIYARPGDDGKTGNSATFPRFLTTGRNLKPVPFSPEKKRKDCTIM
ncbi:uncharacterized protein LOC124261477 [Haliotis rubra]|uniref:uncharacterized protein LOC124261477 n=1 Tax=Haliotis rubra TaxID=36100 RepID=UPI001EE5AAE1|nr:uncharacterized protein LOC124261477 [Haliotis rubra]